MRKLDERGQGMTEYIIIVALIAIATIAAVKYFGGKTKDSFNAAGDSIQTERHGQDQAHPINEPRPARRRGEKGQSLVEAALALPVLLLFFMALLQLIALGWARVLCDHAAQAAARVYTVRHSDDEDQAAQPGPGPRPPASSAGPGPA